MSLEENRPAAAAAGQTLKAAQLGPIPSRYSTGAHQVICDNIRAGNRPVTAAQMAGIPSNIYYHWMKLGKEGNPHLAQFAEDVELACGVAEGNAVAAITSSYADPDNAKWWLERARASGYSKEVNLKVDAMINEFMDRLQSGLPPDIWDKVLAVGGGANLQISDGRTPLQLVEINDVEPSS